MSEIGGRGRVKVIICFYQAVNPLILLILTPFITYMEHI